jgi:DNA replication ATP-dependent helicase Dna2
MLIPETIDFFYKELENIFISTVFSPKEKISQFRSIFNKIIKSLTDEEPQLFSGNFSRIIFLLDKLNVPDKLAVQIKKVRSLLNRSYSVQDYIYNNEDVNFCFQTICFTLKNFTSSLIPQSIGNLLKDIRTKDNSYKFNKPKSEHISELKVVVIKINVHDDKNLKVKLKPELICESEQFGRIKLMLSDLWIAIYYICWEGSIINLFDVKILSKPTSPIEDLIVITTTPNSLVVLEPDYLIDVTDLAECFTQKGSNHNLYFLKKFIQSGTKPSMVAGNLINSCFDELLNNNNVEFEEAYDRAIKIKPLQLFSIAAQNSSDIKIMKEKVAQHFENLKKIITNLNYDYFSIEPTFISPKYGLQGRLDVLLEYDDEINRKNIIELKSGSAPSPDYALQSAKGQTIRTGIWVNNFAQTTCYNMLLDSAYENRTGSSQILYSSAHENPLRNAPNIIQKKQDVMFLRNLIVANERALMLGNNSIFKNINPDDFGDRPSFTESHINEFAQTYFSATELERKYFHEYISFLLREIHSSKIGSNENINNNGFSSLWNDSLQEKENAFSVLSYLKLIPEESDFESFYLCFRTTDATTPISSLRKGDLCILYPINSDGQTNPVNQQIIKCTIKEISNVQIIISLRNKLFNKSFFEQAEHWVLEQDYIDSTNKGLFNSLYKFLKAPDEKKDLLFGLRQPEFIENSSFQNNELNSKQLKLLQSALSANDYFLLQGPPGTGKTSYMLKNIIEQLYKTTEDNILILAYTNRAVDEICSALKRIKLNDSQSDEIQFPFLRLGSKESSEHQEYLISYLAENIPFRELYIKILNTRIFVSTVSSVLSNPEIMDIKKFDIAVIDEATQILEPQIVGILSDVKRFIMIGDEKQLPAVVSQSSKHLKIENELLNEIHLTNFSGSLFERLLKNCIDKQWVHAFGMLNYQARMHKDIQEFPNSRFYNYELMTFPQLDWQNSDEHKFKTNSENPLEILLSKSRIIFIQSESEKNSKVHFKEAKRVAALINTISEVYGKSFNDRTVGVIAPFRAQCYEIYKNLPPNVSTQVTVDTVERFQGSEREIIIISFALNNIYQMKNMQSLLQLGNVNIDRKLNVALTRARQHLILLGVPEILSYSAIFHDLIEFIKQKNGYISSDEFDEI